jgi:hypothetical protein
MKFEMFDLLTYGTVIVLALKIMYACGDCSHNLHQRDLVEVVQLSYKKYNDLLGMLLNTEIPLTPIIVSQSAKTSDYRKIDHKEGHQEE